MAATKTIKQLLNHQLQHVAYFAATQQLFNQLAAFSAEFAKQHDAITPVFEHLGNLKPQRRSNCSV